ncbi:MAG: 4Fe-4S binding protein, partial [Phycisphaerae bacterium]
RWIVFGLTIFSLAYFGFYRAGCVCPVGSIQNVTLGIFDPQYTIPWTVAAFFALPLVFALFAGRVFCAGVCPLGAIQDLILWKPIQVRPWIETTLGLFAYAYLGLALLLAATGSQFVICSWDPFVGIFRLSGTIGMILLGVGLLLASMFVGRIYCRFICPYSVLLRLTSRLSQWKVHISPAACVDCRLCEKSCPYGAIFPPARDAATPDASRLRQRRLIGSAATVLLMLGGAWAGWAGRGVLSQMNQTVQLARTIQNESVTTAPAADPDLAERVQAWHNQGESPEALFARAALIQHRFGIGGALLGAGFLLIVGKRFLSHTAPAPARHVNIYDADPAGCLACARCFKHCPVERQRRGEIAPASPASIPSEEVVT